MQPESRVHTDGIVIDRRFRGPPSSANGGYACGVIGCRLHGMARVRLNVPPPLDTPMSIREPEPGTAELVLGDVTVGRAERADAAWEVPAPVDFERAMHASAGFAWYEGHPLSSCFVCGPDRVEGDGLRIFAGPVPERRIVAAPWRPDPSVCDASGRAGHEIVWAALDCPSWFGIMAVEPEVRPALLGELTARIIERPREGARCVVIGWSTGREGRKLNGGTAIYGEDGTLLASSRATWVELKVPPPVDVRHFRAG